MTPVVTQQRSVRSCISTTLYLMQSSLAQGPLPTYSEWPSIPAVTHLIRKRAISCIKSRCSRHLLTYALVQTSSRFQSDSSRARLRRCQTCKQRTTSLPVANIQIRTMTSSPYVTQIDTSHNAATVLRTAQSLLAASQKSCPGPVQVHHQVKLLAQA